MRKLAGSMVLATLALGTSAPWAIAGDVDISVVITGQIVPGVYGRVDVGGAPPPQVVYAQPLVIEPPVEGVILEPIYLYVPPGHAKHWGKHCHEYHACNRPVYFVWSPEYEPGYRPGNDQGEDEDHDGHGHRHKHEDQDD